jgi:hypothetical protein
MPRACASDIRQGIRGIGYNQYHAPGAARTVRGTMSR